MLRKHASTCHCLCLCRLKITASSADVHWYHSKICFFGDISYNTRWFWWTLVHSFLNKFATKWCKRFPPHLNSVSTLSCETWNAHRASATIELLQKETPKFIPPQLWPPKSSDLNPLDNSMWEILQEKVYKTHHWSAAIDDDATDKWLLQWQHDPGWPSPFSVAVSVHSDQWCV